jgi:hypothetical protein
MLIATSNDSDEEGHDDIESVRATEEKIQRAHQIRHEI